MTSQRTHRIRRGLAWPLALALALLLPLGAWAWSGTGHFVLESIGYMDGTHARAYAVAPNFRQASGSLNQANSTISSDDAADVYVNFNYDTSGKNVWGVYTTDGTAPNKSNGTPVVAAFSKYADPNRTWYATIPAQAVGVTVNYVFYISDSDLASAWGRISGTSTDRTTSQYQTLWTEDDNAYFTYSVCGKALTVTSDADSGDGTLRQAIADACVGGSITFNGDTSIALDSELAIDKHLTIDGGSHAVTVSGADATRVFNIGASGVVTLSHLSIVSGTVTGNGGGIYNAGTVNVTHCTLAGNAATAGGGLYNAGGAVVVEASTLISNTAISHGGGLYTTGGTVTVVASTLAYNQITQSAYCASGSGGGGLHNNGGTLIVQNSTLANNAAFTNCGGGLFNAGRATVRASTLSGNSADYGGGIWNESGYLELQQTIVANSRSGHDCHCGMNGTNVTSLDGLFEATGAHACGVSGDYNTVFGVNPLLGPLADNGGPTPTFALLPNSPAIDAVWLGGCLAPDQRGLPRNDLRCDTGAFELQHSDSATVVRTTMVSGKQTFFGPTRLRVTVTGGDAGTITATKHLTTPGGVYNTGEITATWWLTASGETFTATVAFCYTPEEIAGLSETDLRAFRWDGSAWENRGGVVADGCVIVEDITAFSAWTLFDTNKGTTPTAARTVGVAARGLAPFLAGLFALGGAVAVAFRRRRR